MSQNRGDKKQVRILFIQGVSRYGGALKSLFHTMVLAKERGFYPVLVTSREGKLTRDCEAFGIKFYTFPIGMWRKVKSWPFFPIVYYRLFKVAMKENIDLIHCNTLWDAPYGIILGKIIGKPVVVHLRNEHSEKMLAKYFVRHASVLVGVSFACLSHMDPDLRRRSLVIYNPEGISIRMKVCGNNIKVKDSVFVISIVGRLDSTKGQLEFLEVVYPHVLEKIIAKLYIVGATSKKEKHLEVLMENYQKRYDHSLVYVGYVENVDDYYALSDVVVVPSKKKAHEGLPRVVIEAFEFGKAVIATDSGGSSEVVFSGKTGFLVDDINSISFPLFLCFKHPKIRKVFGINARIKKMQKFSKLNHVKKMGRVWKLFT